MSLCYRIPLRADCIVYGLISQRGFKGIALDICHGLGPARMRYRRQRQTECQQEE